MKLEYLPTTKITRSIRTIIETIPAIIWQQRVIIFFYFWNINSFQGIQMSVCLSICLFVYMKIRVSLTDGLIVKIRKLDLNYIYKKLRVGLWWNPERLREKPLVLNIDMLDNYFLSNQFSIHRFNIIFNSKFGPC